MLCRILIGVPAIAGALAMASASEAACVQKDLAGTYALYGIWTDQLEAGWTRCTLRVANNGQIRSGSICRDSDGDQGALTSGRLRITTSCVVTGRFTSQGAASKLVSTLDEAQLDRTKGFIAGVGHDSDGSIWLLNAVKR